MRAGNEATAQRSTAERFDSYQRLRVTSSIIVPWAAGGSTDQMARIVAAEVEGPLGQRVVVVNQPGASGSIGTRNALEAPKDGYTWAAGIDASEQAAALAEMLALLGIKAA